LRQAAEARNISSIVLDKAKFPRFKPCAGWVTPQVLRWVGEEVDNYPHGLTEFTSFDVSLNGFKFKLPTHQYSIRRFEFDDWLLQLAEPQFYMYDVREIRQENGEYVVDDEFSAHYLVGAGGTHCPVYQTFFSQISPKGQGAMIVAQEENSNSITRMPAASCGSLRINCPGMPGMFPKGTAMSMWAWVVLPGN